MVAAMPDSPHVWKFFRTGGLDQVALETGGDLLALGQLDQKLWVALSCPVRGLELDENTLALIDTDHDSRIRVPELLAAVNWAARRLQDPGDLLKGAEALPLAAISETTAAGKALRASVGQILASLGQTAAGAITVADAADTARIFAASPLNGDGVIPAAATEDPTVQALIADIIACHGGTAGRMGTIGVTAATIGAFFGDVDAHLAWLAKNSAPEIACLGEATADAVESLRVVRAKVNDYFARCRLATFDARAVAALNRPESDYAAIAALSLTLTSPEVAGLPLARVAAHQPLPLLEGVNPAWAGAVARLQGRVVAPVLGAEKTTLTDAEWTALDAKFSAYETWLGTKTGDAVERLGVARLREIAAGPGREALARLVARDRELAPHYQALADVERLARYYRDLRALLHNFVNFADFYSRDRWAAFQAGTLYLDSRSCELCIKVEGPNPLAAMGKTFIAYVTCTRAGAAPMTVACCFSQGGSDYLFAGRHGVFYDRQGRDWDAVITSIVDNPISLRQAFWAPYKKAVRMIDELAAKRAAAANAAAAERIGQAADKVVTSAADAAAAAAAQQANPGSPPPQPPPPPPLPPPVPKKLDVGVVAALGVAVGAISGALATVGARLADLHWWQVPIMAAAIVLVISLPSVLIAWLKLRQRTLGPILDANGWAINGRVKINIPFGTALTATAALPAGARRSLEDPYEDKTAARQRRGFLLLLLLLALGLAAARWFGVWPFGAVSAVIPSPTTAVEGAKNKGAD
jgi:hypothetical protein